MKTTYYADIIFHQCLNESGQLVCPLPDQLASGKPLVESYKWMVLSRLFDNKAISLQRTGQLGTYASSCGCEAIDSVTAALMNSSDVLVPYYRNHIMQVIRGAKFSEILGYWGGDERGNAALGQHQDLPNAVPIATQYLHACGVATAIKIRHQGRAVVAMIGDGGTSKGDFYEALNVAGAWQLPVVFIINNNQWAISVPRQLQTAAQTLAQKGIGAGIQCEQVDGNDAIALHQRISLALDHARKGKGPSLIEAVSYRLSDHTTADDATRYREPEALKAAWDKEPIKRLRQFLSVQGWWDETQEQQLNQACALTIQTAVDEYLKTPAPSISDMFDYLFETLPASTEQQKVQAMALAEKRGQK